MLVLIPTLAEATGLFSDNLPPTQVGSQSLAQRLLQRGFVDLRIEGRQLHVAICGAGLAAAGAGAAFAIGKWRPSKIESDKTPVVLLGIAGSYDPHAHPLGSAVIAHSSMPVGVGVGSNESGDNASHEPLHSLPWARRDPFVMPEVLPLYVPPQFSAQTVTALSAASASANPAEARARKKKYPDAAIEEMESAAVAVAAARWGKEFVMLRGISNCVGERSTQKWCTEEALQEVRKLFMRCIPVLLP